MHFTEDSLSASMQRPELEKKVPHQMRHIDQRRIVVEDATGISKELCKAA